MVLRLNRRHAGTIVMMQDAFAIVLFVVVGVSVVVAIASLFVRGKLYDDIGRGGLSIGDDRDEPPRRSTGPPIAVDTAERDAEIRQMLEARNARRAARGEATVDVEAELRDLTHPAADPGLREEVRTLVEARNARRIARGQPPLDVEAEIERQLRGLPG
jgi:hypothetical protein